MKTKNKVIAGAVLILAVVSAFAAYSHFKEKKRISQGWRCCSNLRMLDSAKEQAAINLGLKAKDLIPEEEVAKYCINRVMPKCPSGGIYSIRRVSEIPKCSLGITNVVNPIDSSIHRLPIGE